MITIREIISELRKDFKESNPDSRTTNKFFWSKIKVKSPLLISKLSNELKLSLEDNIFQEYLKSDIIPVPAVDPCFNFTSVCKIYRSDKVIPEMYSDISGPIIKSIRTADRRKKIVVVPYTRFLSMIEDVDFKYDKNIYAYFLNGYIYLTRKLPIIIEAFFQEDISKYNKCNCKEDEECVKFLDKKFFFPSDFIDILMASIKKDMAELYIKIPEQKVIDKNPST